MLVQELKDERFAKTYTQQPKKALFVQGKQHWRILESRSIADLLQNLMVKSHSFSKGGSVKSQVALDSYLSSSMLSKIH